MTTVTIATPSSASTIPEDTRALWAVVDEISRTVAAPRAAEVDRDCVWPAHTMQAMADAGLMGLHVPRALGGHQQGLMALTWFCQTLARSCSASALCYGMHCVGSAVIAAKANHHQEETFLRRIAAGEHITTLALSETGTGSHFYFPESHFTGTDGGYRIDGEKCFVTNGSHADSYVVSAIGADQDTDVGEFSCLIVEGHRPGIRWGKEWNGIGMRGNSSRSMALEGVEVPRENLLGDHGDQIWYVFEVVAPYFLLAMAGTYVGVAEAAVAAATADLKARTHNHTGDKLAEQSVLQAHLADMWLSVERTRAMVHHAAALGDLGDENALVHILSAKVAAAESAVQVANEALTLCGGRSYRENSQLARLLRDARASHIMAPTTHQLKQWTGRALLGVPLL